MNIAYKERIRTMKRNFNSGIFKKDPRPYVMLVLSHFIAYTIFPCIIIYKHLPGAYFASITGAQDKSSERVAWMGQVNVGSFLITYSAAIFLTSKKFRPDQVDWKSKTWLLCLFIVVEAACALYILILVISNAVNYKTASLSHEHTVRINLNLSMAYFAMLVVAFLHGLITAHFLTLKPDGVYQEKQPQAYTERDFARHLGICLGILV